MPDRRSVLATLAALSLAGCVGAPGDEDPSTPRGSPAGSPTATDEPGPGGEEPTVTDTPAPPDSVDGDWPLPGRDAGRSNAAPGTAVPSDGLAPLWRSQTDAALAGPVLADGTLYLGGDDGVVRALDALTGAVRWRSSVEGAARTPHVRDGRVYVPTKDAVHALDAADGTTAWRVEAPRTEGVVVAGHGVYRVAGGDDPALVGHALDDGSRLWRAELGDARGDPVFATPSLVFVSSGGYDSVPWAFTADDGSFVGERRPRRGADFAAEQFVRDGRLYAGDGFFGNVRSEAVSPEGYGDRWRTGVDAYSGFELAGGVDRVFLHAEAGDRPGLYALSTDDGATAWVDESVEAVRGRPVVADDAVLVRTPDALRCFAAADGVERWSHPVAGEGGRLALADDVVFTASDGTVRAFVAAAP